MAKPHTAFLRRSEVPARQALQEALQSLKFRLTVDEAYVPFECDGYIPATLDGEDAGFEIKFGDSAAQLADAPQLQAQLEGRDTAITLRGSGDPREEAAAMMITAALAQNSGALVRRKGDDTFRSADQLLKDARAVFEQLQEQ